MDLQNRYETHKGYKKFAGIQRANKTTAIQMPIMELGYKKLKKLIKEGNSIEDIYKQYVGQRTSN